MRCAVSKLMASRHALPRSPRSQQLIGSGSLVLVVLLLVALLVAAAEMPLDACANQPDVNDPLCGPSPALTDCSTASINPTTSGPLLAAPQGGSGIITGTVISNGGTPEECCNACQKDPSCDAWNYLLIFCYVIRNLECSEQVYIVLSAPLATYGTGGRGAQARCDMGTLRLSAGSGTGDPHLTAAILVANRTEELFFDFMGAVGKFYCMVTDSAFQFNARMKGHDQQPGLTWMDAVGLTYLNPNGSRQSISIVLDQALAEAGKHPFIVDFGEDDVTEAIDTSTVWKSPDGVAAIQRSADIIAQLTVTIAGLLEMELTTDKDGIHFLNFKLKKIITSTRVHGVLGQMYAPGAVEERLAMGTLEGFNHREYVEGSDEDYETSSLTAPGCSYTQFDLPHLEATTSLPRALDTASLPTQTRRKKLSTSVVECRQMKHTAKGVSLVCTSQ